MMKTNYERATLDVVALVIKDVITTSSPIDGSGNTGSGGGILLPEDVF